MAEVGPAEFVRRLVLDGVVESVRGPVSRRPGAEGERVRYLQDLIAKAVSKWLAESGGWRRRDVVVGGREIRDKRIWDPDVWSKIDFTFSQASWDLAAAVIEWRAGQSDRKVVLQPGLVAGLKPKTMGDIVWFHLVIDPLIAAALGSALGAEDGEPAEVDEDERPAKKPTPRGRVKKAPVQDEPTTVPVEVIGASPLTAIYRPDVFPGDYGDGDSDSRGWKAAIKAAQDRLASLVAKERAVVLTFLDDSIARAWLEAEERRRDVNVAESGARYASLAVSMEGLLQACEDSGRLDAMRPALRYFERYVVRFGKSSAIIETIEAKAKGVVRHVDRQQFTRLVASMFGAADQIADAAEDVLEARPADRSAADKAFLKAYQGDGDLEARGLKEIVEDLDVARKKLSDELGS